MEPTQIVQQLAPPCGHCAPPQPGDPCALVIFGASGDLTARKIMPALYTLFSTGALPQRFFILGCARSQHTTDSFRVAMQQAVITDRAADDRRWQDFAGHLYYESIAYDQPDAHARLKTTLEALDRQLGCKGNRLFYLAVPPMVYAPIVETAAGAGLYTPVQPDAWCRIVIEKPFGSSLETAAHLDGVLRHHFAEHQIYRIDHYLAKETVQNILVFRFANAIFEPVWNRQYIDAVDIYAAEMIGVEHRAGYYEHAGVLRDMFQNHILQLLALIAMEPPARFAAEMVRDEKAKLLRSLQPVERVRISDNLVLGQYTAGMIDGIRVPAYRDETGVDPGSLVPTYALLRVCVDNWRWQGVPFYLMAGKRLATHETRIVIHFKDVPHAVFRDVVDSGISANRLTFRIQPDEKISLTFQAKAPASSLCLRSIDMEFSYADDRDRMYDAYEKVLLDCIAGERMLFLRQDAEALSWSFLTPVLEASGAETEGGGLLHFYEPGSWGPPAARVLRGRPW